MRYHKLIRILTLPALSLLMAFTIVGIHEEPKLKSSKGISEKIYPEHLTGTFTGGFGEETCRSCHFDYDLNPDGGTLSVSGIPQKITEGEIVDIQITVEREELGRAGFQLSARYKSGKQAGQFKINNDRIMLSKSVPDSLEYVQHSTTGTEVVDQGKGRWTISWQAPDELSEPIIFNIAANAANGDQSEFGDFIYVRDLKIHP